MTDKKISELPALEIPSASDVFAIVNAAATKQIRYDNLGFLPLSGGEVTGQLTFPGIFGGISVDGGAAPQTIPTGATHTKLTAYVDNDPSSAMSPDVANDKITVIKAGYYMVNCSLNFSDDVNLTTWHAAPFLDGAEYGSIHIERKIGTAGDVGSASMSGILTVSSVPVDLDIRVLHDKGGDVDITVTHSNLALHYLGEI